MRGAQEFEPCATLRSVTAYVHVVRRTADFFSDVECILQIMVCVADTARQSSASVRVVCVPTSRLW